MKYLFIVLLSFSLSACGTLGGAMSGAGDDLNRAGEYIRSVGK